MVDDNKFWGDVEEEEKPKPRLEQLTTEGIAHGCEYAAENIWCDFIDDTDAEFFGETKNTIIGVECLRLNIQSSIQALMEIGKKNETGDLDFSPTALTEMNRAEEQGGGVGDFMHIRLDNYITDEDIETPLEKELYRKLMNTLQYANHSLEFVECLLIFYMVLERCNNFDINEHQNKTDGPDVDGDKTDG